MIALIKHFFVEPVVTNKILEYDSSSAEASVKGRQGGGAIFEADNGMKSKTE